MKVIGVLTFIVSVSAILSCTDGVPTLVPATENNTEAIPITDANANPITPVTSVNAPGLNPAHGQPGHRCDIAVGQPLNSKPGIQSSNTINPVTVGTTRSPTPARTFTVPFTQPNGGLNPPHGQPGHRCDIQVGQPLNSKPAQPVTSPTVKPAPTTTTAVAPGMNPPHGQPGHRCDIQVGQPLNSKPVQTSAQATPITPLNIPARATTDSTKG